jgi:hypothetical protein
VNFLRKNCSYTEWQLNQEPLTSISTTSHHSLRTSTAAAVPPNNMVNE